ncbi:hypothetical protein QYF36_001392 [Acer negundo]|nr:hypothetical protein QYF36_001392 [Acer negundo]
MKKRVSHFGEQSSSTSSDSGIGHFGKSGLFKGESSHHNRNVVALPDPTRGVDPVLLDFALADHDSGLDLSSVVLTQRNGPSPVDFSNFHIDLRGVNEPFRKALDDSRKVGLKKFQLMMKKGLLKTSLVPHWNGQHGRRCLKEAAKVVPGIIGENSHSIQKEDGSSDDNSVIGSWRKSPHRFLAVRMGVWWIRIRVVDVEGNEVAWHLDGKITRVIETGAVLGFNLRDNRKERMDDETESVVGGAQGELELGGGNCESSRN